jgi:co-chaperonin GroES (HSP10)
VIKDTRRVRVTGNRIILAPNLEHLVPAHISKPQERKRKSIGWYIKNLIIEPHPDRMIVVQDEHAEDIGRIHVPDEAKARPTTGYVIAVGANQTLYKKGDRLLFPMFAGNAFAIAGKEYTSIGENEIIGKIKTKVQNLDEAMV